MANMFQGGIQSGQVTMQTAQTNIQMGPQFNDRDRLNDVLETEKYLTLTYAINANEASNQALFNTIMDLQTDAHRSERMVYDTMMAKGWYSVPSADQQKITQTFSQFSGYKSQLPNVGGTTLQ